MGFGYSIVNSQVFRLGWAGLGWPLHPVNDVPTACFFFYQRRTQQVTASESWANCTSWLHATNQCVTALRSLNPW